MNRALLTTALLSSAGTFADQAHRRGGVVGQGGETDRCQARGHVEGRGRRVVIGPETRRRIGDTFRVEPLGERSLKNLSERIEVHRVLR